MTMMRYGGWFLLFLTTVHADFPRPDISVSLKSVPGKPELGSLSPVLQWTTGGSVADCDIDGGLSLTVDETGDMPYKLWAKVKSTLLGCQVAARFDTSSAAMNRLGVDLQVAGGPIDTAVQIKGSVDMMDEDVVGNVQVQSIKLSQSVDEILGGTWTVQPGYNLPAEQADVKVSYRTEGVALVVDANTARQKLTLMKELGEANRIAPSITTDGEVGLEYSRAFPAGTLTTTVKPKDSVNLLWSDGGGKWALNLNAPLEGVAGIQTDGVKFSATCSGV